MDSISSIPYSEKRITDYKKIIIALSMSVFIFSMGVFTHFKVMPIISSIMEEPLPCPLPEKAEVPVIAENDSEYYSEGSSADTGGFVDRLENARVSPMLVDTMNNMVDKVKNNANKSVNIINNDELEYVLVPEEINEIRDDDIESSHPPENISCSIFNINKVFEDNGIKMTPHKYEETHDIGYAYYGEGHDFNPKVGEGILTKAEFKEMCEKAGAEFGVDPMYLEAMAETESSLNRYARNGSHYGLFQISNHWHAGRMAACGVTDLYDPLGNTRVAAMIVRDLAAENPDPAYILMCYNQGQKSAIPMYNSGKISGYATKIINRRNYIAEHGYL